MIESTRGSLRAHCLEWDFHMLVFALYRSVTAAVTIGGHVGSSFTLSRLVRQGCSLAPYLFPFFAETMALYLRGRTPQIQGLHMPIDGSPDPVEQEYVNDTVIYCQYDFDTLNRLRFSLCFLLCQWFFDQLAQGFVVGADDVCRWGEHQGFTWVAPGQTCRYLGFHIFLQRRSTHVVGKLEDRCQREVVKLDR
ncbi:hypothetical protein L7F22_022881 [Adiantum nelumboides]|nr:hypothetical protein [Adiantum nelumboides]